MKIGDVVTLPKGIHIDPEALRYALNRRGATAAAANAKVHNARRNGARAVMREVERREHAAKDPFEQARHPGVFGRCLSRRFRRGDGAPTDRTVRLGCRAGAVRDTRGCAVAGAR
ncbi:hypothetical protein GO308_12775 [Sphingomonas sp. SFZ2018-12]|uniref:hypothetical protein n=1 Tax=Sphingomonas sp. SFZ2018-12 TaxID=2683197 RepID=UPI001F107EB5|nr:hypothetical protein [Sphingomonas sp. SFZ2018-12]MCH4893989.1 hypothetical protein [Sphingomonas sp. SFZ2018-12]